MHESQIELHDLLGRFALVLEDVPGPDVAMDALQDVVGSIGFSSVDYAYLPVARGLDGAWMPPSMRTRNFPRRWDRDLDRHRQHDPYFHASFRGTEIVDWAEVQNNADQLTRKERDCLNYIGDVGFSFGLTVPMHMPGGSFAFISALGDGGGRGWAQQASRSKRAVFLIAHYFNNMMVTRFEHICRSNQDELSQRELECLSWCALGKTIDETAVILGLSMETVRVYLKRAKHKLNAVNCAHAVAKAIYLGVVAGPI